MSSENYPLLIRLIKPSSLQPGPVQKRRTYIYKSSSARIIKQVVNYIITGACNYTFCFYITECTCKKSTECIMTAYLMTNWKGIRDLLKFSKCHSAAVFYIFPGLPFEYFFRLALSLLRLKSTWKFFSKILLSNTTWRQCNYRDSDFASLYASDFIKFIFFNWTAIQIIALLQKQNSLMTFTVKI